jgi:hypothetical protein
MEKQKLIGNVDALKSAFVIIRKNENIGYFFKSMIFASLIISIGTVIMYVIMFASGGYKNTYSSSSSSSTSTTSNMPPLPTKQNDWANDYLNQYNNQPSQDKYKSNYELSKKTSSKSTDSAMAGVVLIGSLIMACAYGLYGTFVSILDLRLSMDMTEGTIRGIKELYKDTARFLIRFLILTLVEGLVVFLGFLLFIIPGIIFSVMYAFAPIIMVKEDVGPLEAMKRSSQLVKGYKMDLFVKFIGLSVLSTFIVLPAAFILLMPFGQLSTMVITLLMYMILYVIYKDLKNIKTPQPPAIETAPALDALK